jgi:type II secretory pathway predicted ATPase ExeA
LKNYISLLGLEFDPFEPGARSRDFFFTQSSQQLLSEVFDLSLYSTTMISISGPLGSGKSTLIEPLVGSYGEEAQTVAIKASLFMTPMQFLEALMERMEIVPDEAGDVEQCLEQLQRIAEQMDMDARYLILIVDDAHEMSAEVLQVLQDISARSENIRSILIGESQLENMLRSAMGEEGFDQLARFDLQEFGSEEVNEYISFKLETAGYKGALPLSGVVIGGLVNESNGIPGTVNALASDALENSYEEQQDADENGSVNILRTVTPAHYGAAATLFVLLLAILIFWDSGEEPDMPAASDSMLSGNDFSADFPDSRPANTGRTTLQIPIEINTDNPQRAAADALAQVEESTQEVPLEAVEELVPEVLQEVVQEVVQEAAQEPVVQQLLPQEQIARSPVTEVEPGSVASQLQLSPFEAELMNQPRDNLTIQLLGSRSEENVEGFRGSNSRPGMGYFQTVYQQQPWFVLILGSFDSRANASEIIDTLPQSLRSLEPWVRSIGDIQDEIREYRSP